MFGRVGVSSKAFIPNDFIAATRTWQVMISLKKSSHSLNFLMVSAETLVRPIKLRSWYILDTKLGQFGHCDPEEWALVQPGRERNSIIEHWTWGYGFSYVHRRDLPINQGIQYPDVSMSEDYAFFKELAAVCGEERAILLPDDIGICLHLLHGRC